MIENVIKLNTAAICKALFPYLLVTSRRMSGYQVVSTCIVALQDNNIYDKRFFSINDSRVKKIS